jgi:hypothetical protein
MAHKKWRRYSNLTPRLRGWVAAAAEIAKRERERERERDRERSTHRERISVLCSV